MRYSNGNVSPCYLGKRSLLTAFVFLAILFSTSCGFASDSHSRLSVFLAGGSSYPVGKFSDIAKIGPHWAGGVELQFPSNWALGFDLHWAQFDHQKVYYSSWHRSWTYVDWGFIRGNLYAKYFAKARGFSPFVKFGLGLYSMENKRTYLGTSSTKGQMTGYSLVPGIGLRYSTKRFSIFAEVDHNFVFRRATGGCTSTHELSQFFDLYAGLGFFLLP